MVRLLEEVWYGFVSLIKGLLITFYYMVFKRSVTVQYPKERRKVSPIFRGRLSVKVDEGGKPLCGACGICERSCPNKAIKVVFDVTEADGKKKKVLKDFIVDHGLCMYCGLCVENCPRNALFWVQDYEFSSYTREGLSISLLRDAG